MKKRKKMKVGPIRMLSSSAFVQIIKIWIISGIFLFFLAALKTVNVKGEETKIEFASEKLL